MYIWLKKLYLCEHCWIMRLLFFLIKFCLYVSKRNIFKKINKKVSVDDRSNLEINENWMDKFVILSYKEFFSDILDFSTKAHALLNSVYNTDYKCWIINWSALFSKKIFCKTIKISFFFHSLFISLKNSYFVTIFVFDHIRLINNQIPVEIL